MNSDLIQHTRNYLNEQQGEFPAVKEFITTLKNQLQTTDNTALRNFLTQQVYGSKPLPIRKQRFLIDCIRMLDND